MLSFNSLFVFASLFLSILAHSQMRCAKYDIATGTCLAPIRNEAYSKMQEGYEISGGLPICQFPMSNPISAYYANGASCPDWAPCPSPMGTYQQGENFTVMWFARNHATPDQNPGTVTIYTSPLETSDQNGDLDRSAYTAICKAPYMSCNGQNGNEVQCYATCKMPTTTPVGIHTLWWKWDWQSAIYSTCADIVVTAGSNSVTPTPVPTPTPTPVTPSPVPTPSVPATTASVPIPSTTARVVPSVPVTTARVVPVMPATTASTPASTTAQATPLTTAQVPVVSSTSTPSNQACNLGDQMCVGVSQYQTCTNGREANYWAAPQTCRTGLVCKPSTTDNNHIYCQRP